MQLFYSDTMDGPICEVSTLMVGTCSW